MHPSPPPPPLTPLARPPHLHTGKTWIDTYGDYTLLCTTTGAKAYLYFQPCGWFGSGRYEVRRGDTAVPQRASLRGRGLIDDGTEGDCLKLIASSFVAYSTCPRRALPTCCPGCR